jgi:hypothetical protein
MPLRRRRDDLDETRRINKMKPEEKNKARVGKKMNWT